MVYWSMVLVRAHPATSHRRETLGLMEIAADTAKHDAFLMTWRRRLRASWNSVDVIGRAITSAITKPLNLHKSFTISTMHGEGIEPPTYWV
jgi:hypothetical protein